MSTAALVLENRNSPVALELLSRPVRDLTFVAFDTETTGRHPIISRMVEISAIKFKGNGQILGKRTQLINPEQVIPPDVTAIHGITQNMVAQMPKYQEVIPSFVDWMSANNGSDHHDMPVMVAHNANFDVGFLQVALSRMQMSMPQNAVLDTLSLSRKLIHDSDNHKLKTLIEHLGYEAQTYHRAEADSLHVMKLFLHLISKLDRKCTLGNLLDESGAIFFKDPITVLENYSECSNPRVVAIGAAIENEQDLQIHYRGFGIKDRKITPFSVMRSGKKYYLSAYCHQAKGERTFRVNRIASMSPVERSELGSKQCQS
ncbi:MAG: WYL domain-containing protein [Candidatus Obscuribacterales bacterium]|jgi:DNA polymerase III epsilon subunit family exonuclease|nr:WYL domain-containing protein [Candidatus Obscuribacterales bacterium]